MQDHNAENVYGFIKKSIALIVGAMLFLSVFFSKLYIAEEFVHDCSGEECPICQTIAECEAFINKISTGLVMFVAAFLMVISLSKIVATVNEAVCLATPVAKKVRLNN